MSPNISLLHSFKNAMIGRKISISTNILDMIEKLQLKPIKALQKLMGGWPVIDHEWKKSSWSWQKMVKDLEKIGFPANFVFELTLGSDVKNTSKRTLGVRFDRVCGWLFIQILIGFRSISRHWVSTAST